jgi:predicted ATPase
MHTGINTGLVVTGSVKSETGTHGVLGDTINLAARLNSVSKEGEVLVGPDTFKQARGYFGFEALPPVQVKGKSEPISIYRVLAPLDQPKKVHRLFGLRANLIGRKMEIAFLEKALEKLEQKQGSIIAISGPAGTGKSRLAEEFKASLDLDKVQWLSGQAYPYAQNMPYFPLIDLLNNGFRIEEGDPPKKIKRKIELQTKILSKKTEEIVPYIGKLFNLEYPQTERIGPETWKVRLHEAIQEILFPLTDRAPTIICLEDLHWADPSSLELFRFILSDFRYPVIFLCIYRPTITLFTTYHIRTLGHKYQEIRLQDLSLSETRDMIASLLKTDNIPPDLIRLIHEEVEGNPFYIEELINSLIESDILIHNKGNWQMKRSITASDIPPTIQGVIAGRLDRLEKEMKRILQEASVIGRAFFHDILTKVTEQKQKFDYYLSILRHLDLINIRSYQPDLEYLFKHALTQEVVYNGLLKKERQTIHERIGAVIEELFSDRLPEFYEALAFHYQRGRSVDKAIEYLMNSGEKSLNRYALEESHRYFKDAFEILIKQSDDNRLHLIDLLNKWSFVYYYRGRYRELLRMLKNHQQLAESLADTDRLGMFYAWLGCALWHREQFSEAYQYMTSALKIGEENNNKNIIGYACSWLTWISTELGLLDEAVEFAIRAQQIYEAGDGNQYIYINSLAGMGYAFWHKGEKRKTFQVGQDLLQLGQSQSDPRSKVMGYSCLGWSRLIAGDILEATSYFKQAIQVSAAPWYTVFPKLALAYGTILSGRLDDAKELINEIIDFSTEHGAEFAGEPAQFFRGVILFAGGEIHTGIKIIEEKLQAWTDNGSKLRQASCGYILASLYAHIAMKKKKLRKAKIVKNIGFVLKKVPFATQKAKEYFNIYTEAAREIGANGVLGQAYLDWGLLLKEKGDIDSAHRCLVEAIQILEKCEAEEYLKQAKMAMDALDPKK